MFTRLSTWAVGLLAGLALCAASWVSAQEAAPVPAAETSAPAAAPAAETIPPRIPTSVFASRSPYESSKISPDGTRLAMLISVKGRQNLAVMDTETHQFVDRIVIDTEGEVIWFRWAGTKRLIFSLSSLDQLFGEEIRYTRLYVFDLETDVTSYVGGKFQGIDGDNVIFVDPEGEYVLLTMQQSIYDWPDVWRFPLDGSNTKGDEKVVSKKDGIWYWIADDDGVVRIGLGINSSKLKVYYRKSADDSFRIIARLGGKDEDEAEEGVWDVLRIIGGTDEGYVLKKGPSGRLALLNFNYATREAGEPVYENKDWDLTDFALDEEGKPLAVYYTDDRDRIVWLDPKMARLQRGLEKAIGDKELWMASRARDDSRILVWAGAADDPGAYYLYTAAKGTLDFFTELRPGLSPADLAPVKPVGYTARDGTAIRAYLTLPRGRAAKDLPLIILPHGGPYGVRDKLDYDDEVQLLANRGYVVLQPNYRGSDGYGEAFDELGKGQIGRTMQDDLDDAMDWAVAEGIADPKRVCVVGSSYGGYAALWAVTRNPDRYRCAASFAGVTDLKRQLRYDSGFFSSSSRKSWRERIRGEDATFDLDTVSPAPQASRLTRPVLIAQGRKDSNVPFSQFKAMRDALEKAKFDQAEYLIFEDEGHGFQKPENEQKWYDALEAFLLKHNPPD